MKLLSLGGLTDPLYNKYPFIKRIRLIHISFKGVDIKSFLKEIFSYKLNKKLKTINILGFKILIFIDKKLDK